MERYENFLQNHVLGNKWSKDHESVSSQIIVILAQYLTAVDSLRAVYVHDIPAWKRLSNKDDCRVQ
jgi:hypothetical protein